MELATPIMNEKNQLREFRVNEIVCIDLGNLHLFAEMIDSIPISACCWVKPLAIARSNPEKFELEFLHDLRDAAQLILPANLFRHTLDTEVLPLTDQLFYPTKDSNRSLNAQTILYQFITDLYR